MIKLENFATENGIVLDESQKRLAIELDILSEQLQLSNKKKLFSRGEHHTLGLYVFGHVGRGKTMLMDMFFESLNASVLKGRYHFHDFMQMAHNRLKELSSSTKKQQPIILVADEIAKKYKLLCFDEFHVTDIADAMILARLWKELWGRGVVLVATSNFSPNTLYANGLQRELFIPFIELLKGNCKILELQGQLDYRRQFLSGARRYFCNEEALVQQLFDELTIGKTVTPKRISIKGRVVNVLKTVDGVAWFSFLEICDNPLGALDYMTLCENFDTVIVNEIPLLNDERIDQAKRFITFIDVLYDRRVNLIVNAAANADDLYPVGKHADLFKRTASRLIEMTGS